MQGSDLLQRARDKRARDQRLAVIRAAFNELAQDEKEEFGLWVVAEMESGASGAAQPSDAPKATAASPAEISALYQPELPSLHQTALVVVPGKIRVGDAVVAIMRDGVARATGEIGKAVGARFPDVNMNSVPAAVARMVSYDPPQLIKRGKNDRGDALYVIAPHLLSGDVAQASIDDDDDDIDDGSVDIDEQGSGASRVLAVFQRQSGMRVALQSVIAELSDLEPNLIRSTAARYARMGKLKKVRRGVYRYMDTGE